MELALQDLRSSESPNISAIARKYGVERSTLSRRFNRKSTTIEEQHENARLLNQQQESTVVEYIRRQCEYCLPPPPSLVAGFVAQLCGRQPSKNWCARFVNRHSHELDSRYLNTLDLLRHKADSRASYDQYFTQIKKKMDEYKIERQNTYNMDEKGFMIGQLQKTRRIFTKASYEEKESIFSGQDGSREWITLLATICADGSHLSPALIYKSESNQLQDSWLNAFHPQEHRCFFSSSPNGWTSDEISLRWLRELFDKETSKKDRSTIWRLLFIDSHSSHLNLSFLNECQKLRILVAFYPPHSTHRLQPLDVGCFAPLASYYSQGLDELIRQSEGRTILRKQDFFEVFWPAAQKAFSSQNIESAWLKSGIWPFEPERVLKKLPKPRQTSPSTPRGQKRSGDHLPFGLSSPSNRKRLRTILKNAVDESSSESASLMKDTIVRLSCDLTLSKNREQSLSNALNHEQTRRKRSKRVLEELRSEEGSGTLFMSPSKIQRARDIADGREAAKAAQKAQKAEQQLERAHKKALKEAEAERKRTEKAAAKARRDAEAAAKKAANQRVREAKKALKQLEIDQKALSSRRKRRQKQQRLQKTQDKATTSKTLREVSPQATTTRGRPVRRPARLRT